MPKTKRGDLFGMILRSCRAGSWGVVLRPSSLFLILLVDCASPATAPAEKRDPLPLESCEYRNVFVEFDGPSQLKDPRVEPLRRAILSRAADVFHELGLERVADPSDAYWRLFANAWTDRHGNPLVHLGMRGELKLGRHLFVVTLADESFPFRGGTGGSYNFVKASLVDKQRLDAQVETGMRWIWGLDAEQIAALCEVRSTLIGEGWTEIEELRQQLIEEMEQIRRARSRASQQKNIELEVDGRGKSELAE